MCNPPTLLICIQPSLPSTVRVFLSWKPPIHPPLPLLPPLERQRITHADVCCKERYRQRPQTPSPAFLLPRTGIVLMKLFSVNHGKSRLSHATSQIPGWICREFERSPGYLIKCRLSHLSRCTWYIDAPCIAATTELSPLIDAVHVHVQHCFITSNIFCTAYVNQEEVSSFK
jgi:hypothetical protein